MYAQIFFVTSVRGNFFAPQIAASSGAQGVLLDVRPDLLRNLRAGQLLRTADRGELRAENLRGEDALPRLLHGRRIALACGLRSRLAQTTLLGSDLLEGRLRNRRLRRLHRGRRNRRLGSGRHRDRREEMQTRLEPK